MHTHDLISGTDLARMAGVNQSTVSRWVKKGLIVPFFRSAGRRGHMWFLAEDVRRLLDERSDVA